MAFIRNPRGHIHSVTRDHLESMKVGHKDQPHSAWTLPAGFTEVDEAEAREWAARHKVGLFGEDYGDAVPETAEDRDEIEATIRSQIEDEVRADVEAKVRAELEAEAATAKTETPKPARPSDS